MYRDFVGISKAIGNIDHLLEYALEQAVYLNFHFNI